MSVLGPRLIQDVGNVAPMSGIPPKDGVNFTTSVWGTPIPLTQGIRKVTGVPIWASEPFEKTSQTAVAGVGDTVNGIQNTFNNFSLSRNFAVAFGYNLAPEADHAPPQVRRVWADGQLIYSNGEPIPPVTYQSTTGDYSFGENVIGNQLLDNGKLTNPPLSSNLTFRFYTGTEAQVADPLIVADKGDLAPAFRGLMYMVIEGLIVGFGAHLTTDVTIDGYTTRQPQGVIGGALTKPLALPVIVAELMDGTVTAATSQNMALLPGTPMLPNSVALAVDLVDRRYVVTQNDYIVTFDIDGKTESSYTAITGLAVGQHFYASAQELFAWDTINDIVYASLNTPGKSLASVNRATGALIDSWGNRGFDLGPSDAGGGDPTVTGNPCTGVSRPFGGAIGYYAEGGSAHPLLISLYDSCQVAIPSDTGHFPATIPADALFDTGTTDFSPSAQAFPLLDEALKLGSVDSQDAAFIVAYDRYVEIVYVTVRSGVQKIVAHNVIADVGAGRTATAFLDSKNNIIVISDGTGSNDGAVSKIAVTISRTPNYAVAPGWRGVFPVVGEFVYTDVPAPQLPGNMPRYTGPNSDLSQDTIYLGNGAVINLVDGSTKVISSLSGVGSPDGVWDSATSTFYTTGGSGAGSLYQLIGGGLGGSIGTLSAYLRVLALQAGYTDADITIDPALNDPVVGAIITRPYDVNQLFTDLSRIYNFLYLNTGGKLKFTPTTRNPTKASTTWTVSSTGPANGATATIGSVVYTFRTTPAAPFDVQLGATLADTVVNFVNAINGNGTGFFAGTTAHTSVTAVVGSSTTAVISAIQGGTVGNSITTSKTGVNHAFTGATLSGGVAPPAPDVNLTIDDLMFVAEGNLTDKDALITTLAPPFGVATASALQFFSLEQSYQLTEQRYVPDDQGGTTNLNSFSVETFDIPFVMSISEAYSRVAKVALSSVENQVAQEFQLSQKYLRLEPNDVLGITIAPYQYIVRIDEATYNADFSLSLSGYNYAYRNDIALNEMPALGTIPQTVPGLGDSVPVALDIPVLDANFGSIAGLFTIVEGVRSYYGQTGWPGATFYLGGTPLFDTDNETPYGLVQATLPTTSTPWMTDNTTELTILLKNTNSDEFASATLDQFLAGNNVLCVGAPGRWELVYFRDVTVLTNRSVKLTGLLRGRRGTEVNTDNHQANDVAYLLASVATGFVSPVVQNSYPVAQVGDTFTFTASGAGASRIPVPTALVAQGQSLYPWAPTRVRAVASGSDVALSWLRRDRLNTKRFVTDNVVLSEATEKYDLEIMDGATVKRTVANLTSPSYTYLAADIATDGFTGPLTSIKVRVYQIGELGRGFMKEKTVDVQ